MTNRFHNTGLVLVLFMGIAGMTWGCKKDESATGNRLEEAQTLLKGHSFGDNFDRAMSILDTQISDPSVTGEEPRTESQKRAGYRAIMLRSEAHLELLLAALLSGEERLYEKLKSLSGWEMEGELTEIRNFQLLAQEILESFRIVVREADEFPGIQARAGKLAEFASGIQGIHYRNKSQYFAGCEAIRSIDELAFVDDLLAIRDLTFETLRRDGGLPHNWHNATLTTLGRVCLRAATQYLSMVCLSPNPTNAQEYCSNNLEELDEDMLKNGARHLNTFCVHEFGSGDDKVELKGMEAVQRYYDERFEALEIVSETLPDQFRSYLIHAKEDKDSALNRLAEEFFQE